MNKAEEYADNKFTPKAKQYAATSSIKAVYDNCIEDFNAGFNSRQIEIDSLTKEVERLREGLIMAKNYASNTNVIDAIDKVLTTH